MIIKYNINIEDTIIKDSIKRIVNQVYKLLPMREEGADWQKPLNTIMEELAGMNRLLVSEQSIYFAILCKLEGLFTLTEEKDFDQYRRTIFETLSLLSTFERS